MDIIIRLGIEDDIDKLEELYDELNDHLENSINYPGWKRGIYPIREDAVNGIKESALYVASINDRIVGSIILSHKPEPAYSDVIWQKELSYSNVFVIYTFVVHPKYFNQGIGKALIEFSNEHGMNNNVEALRLDVYEGNLPAIKLYEKLGFKYIDTVDLGLEHYGLKWFRVYEKLI
ncbi:MAG: GNAT family N-acetyltransferase [Romboutsia sp.]